MAFFGTARRVPDGQFTQTVYGYIRDQKWKDPIPILQAELQVQAGVNR